MEYAGATNLARPARLPPLDGPIVGFLPFKRGRDEDDILFFSLFNYLYLPFSLSHFKKTCMTFVSLVRARSLESRERTVGTNGATSTLLPFFWTLLFLSFLVGSECPFMWEGTPFITDLSKKGPRLWVFYLILFIKQETPKVSFSSFLSSLEQLLDLVLFSIFYLCFRSSLIFLAVQSSQRPWDFFFPNWSKLDRKQRVKISKVRSCSCHVVCFHFPLNIRWCCLNSFIFPYGSSRGKCRMKVSAICWI